MLSSIVKRERSLPCTDSNLFADTHYHLKPEARKIRAIELVQQLKPAIALQLTAPNSTTKVPQ